MRILLWITDFIKNVYPQYENYPHIIHNVSTGICTYDVDKKRALCL